MNRFKNWKKPIFDENGWAYKDYGDYTKALNTPYGWRCMYHEMLYLGENVDIGCFTFLQAECGIKIGENSQIGSHVSIYSKNTENNTEGEVVIGNNVMIGSHCLILPDSVIPDGTKLKAYSIWRGNERINI